MIITFWVIKLIFKKLSKYKIKNILLNLKIIKNSKFKIQKLKTWYANSIV